MGNRFRGLRGSASEAKARGEGGGNVLIVIGTETAEEKIGGREKNMGHGRGANEFTDGVSFPVFSFAHGMERASEWSTRGHVRNAFCVEIYSKENHRVMACGMFCVDNLA